MEQVSSIGLDLAKNVFQVHGVTAAGRPVIRRQLRRRQLRRRQALDFFARLPPCLVGIEACAGAHFWARELGALGHEVQLMSPAYVKPYVKQGKADAADAEAICEPVTRPTMRFVPEKSAESQATLLLHRMRDFLVRQQTQEVNAIRAHLGEFGIVVAKGIHNVERLLAAVETVPSAARPALELLARQLRETREKIAGLTAEIAAAQRQDEAARRLATIPGVGVLTSSVIAASTPDVSNFRTARDFAAWLGLTPRPNSSGGKARLGRISKAGNRYIRRLLYLGAMAQISTRRKGRPGEDRLWRMLERKSIKLVATALANRMARVIWALLKTGESYRARAA